MMARIVDWLAKGYLYLASLWVQCFGWHDRPTYGEYEVPAEECDDGSGRDL